MTYIDRPEVRRSTNYISIIHVLNIRLVNLSQFPPFNNPIPTTSIIPSGYRSHCSHISHSPYISHSLYLVSIKRPRTELHLAFLFVERKILDVYSTGTFVNSGRNPKHFSVVSDHHAGFIGDFVFTVGTTGRGLRKVVVTFS